MGVRARILSNQISLWENAFTILFVPTRMNAESSF